VNEGLRRLVGEAWAFRTRVEQDAALRFTRLAASISSFDPGSPVIALMGRAAEDERRHAGLCAELAAAYGEPAAEGGPLPDIVPAELGPRAGVLYEVVAACCITETESVATLTTLLAGPSETRVREILHEIARDEVVHGRMGWAHLAREGGQTDVSFLGRWIPTMLDGTVDEGLFSAPGAEHDSEELLRHGVLPQAQKRSIFISTLEGVVFPGLEQFGVDPSAGRAWLAARRDVATAPA